MSQYIIYDTSGILGDVETLTPDDAVAVSPDGNGNINVTGGNGITTFNGVNTVSWDINDNVYTNAEVDTNDGTTTTLYSLEVLVGEGVSIEAMVVGADTTDFAKAISGVLCTYVYNDGIGATLATQFNGSALTPSAPSSLKVDWDTSGDDVRIRVTGTAGETYTWKAFVRFVRVT